MQVITTTMIHHNTEPDGTKRKKHCCGCWHIILEEGASWPIYARCNECDEHREIGRADLGAFKHENGRKIMTSNEVANEKLVEQICEEEAYLYKLAKTGRITPMNFLLAARMVPGYDPKKAPGIEDQWFNNGFPCAEERGG